MANCLSCEHCKWPRSANDNGGACKCKIMKYKTIDVYVSGGETPAWCPLLRGRDRQIEKMAKVFCNNRFENCDQCLSKSICAEYRNAVALYKAGYREPSETAREIFEEIEKLAYSECYSVRADRVVTGMIIDGEMFAELKKKYTQSERE